ncbi:MAG: hypothetical protein AAB437_01495 [Patescibacteria group bacterium]
MSLEPLRILPLIKKTIPIDSFDPLNLLSTAVFLRKNCGSNIRNFLNEQNFLQIKDLVIDLHKDFSRKVTGDSYFKHLFYTAYLCFEQVGDLGFKDDSQKRIFISSALLHDVLEIKRKNHQTFTEENLLEQLAQSGIDETEAKKITTIVSFLTPEPKGPDLSSALWKVKKRKDFDRIINFEPSDEMPLELLEMAKQIKIADEMANLRETVDDVKSGKDGQDREIYDHKPFTDRVAVFEERISTIAGKYPRHSFLHQLQSDLNFLKGCLRSS